MGRGGRREGAGRPRKLLPTNELIVASPMPTESRSERSDPPASSASTDDSLLDAIRRARALTQQMLDELAAITANVGEIEDLIHCETAADRDGRRRNAMMRAVSLSSRTFSLRTLTGAMKTWADLEVRIAAKAAALAGGQPSASAQQHSTPAADDGWDQLVPSPKAMN